MQSFTRLFIISLAFTEFALADTYNLPNEVPTKECRGLSATATMAFSKMPIKTGNATIKAGDYWKQEGAPVWEFSAESKGSIFSEPEIPETGAGFRGSSAVPDESLKAIKLSDDKATITLKVPSPPFSSSWDFMFAVGSPEKVKELMGSETGKIAHPVAITPAPSSPPVGRAKRPPKPIGEDTPLAPPGQYDTNSIMNAKVNC